VSSIVSMWSWSHKRATTRATYRIKTKQKEAERKKAGEQSEDEDFLIRRGNSLVWIILLSVQIKSMNMSFCGLKKNFASTQKICFAKGLYDKKRNKPKLQKCQRKSREDKTKINIFFKKNK
jgi:hypothetical protein